MIVSKTVSHESLGWPERVGTLSGNSRLVFAAACAFAAQLPLTTGSGFHLWGSGCTGKSTALRVAASVGGELRLAQQWVPAGASGQMHQAANRFALVGMTGELATSAGLTGWASGESERGARACFEAWLAA